VKQLSVIVLAVVAVTVVGCTKTVVLKEPEPVRVSASPPQPEPEPEPEPPPRVEVKEERIEVNEKIHFDYNKAEIKPESDELLAEIAKVINEHPELVKIRIEGHTDSVGGAAFNLKLSKRRAKAVRDHLVKKGKVSAGRLVTEGYGLEKPIADNETDEGRAQNRRVAFEIVARSGETPAPAADGEGADGSGAEGADDDEAAADDGGEQ
jgi:OOP family OmpA-OmpF porin